MDLHLHIMNGFETCSKIKTKRNPYIVALSESPIDKILILKCREAGFDDCFVLPITKSDITANIIHKLIWIKHQ